MTLIDEAKEWLENDGLSIKTAKSIGLIESLLKEIDKRDKVIEAAKELNDLERLRLQGEYDFDSFTFQPLRIALSQLED